MDISAMSYRALITIRAALAHQLRWAEWAYSKTDIDNLPLMVWQFDKLYTLREKLQGVENELDSRLEAFSGMLPIGMLLQHIGFATITDVAIAGGIHGGGNSSTAIIFSTQHQ